MQQTANRSNLILSSHESADELVITHHLQKHSASDDAQPASILPMCMARLLTPFTLFSKLTGLL
jgi:hypothetical protein